MSKTANDKIMCNYCGNMYSRTNKSRHRKSKVCQSYQNSIQAFNKILLEDKIKIKTFDDLIKKPFTNEQGKVIYMNNFQLRFLNKLK